MLNSLILLITRNWPSKRGLGFITEHLCRYYKFDTNSQHAVKIGTFTLYLDISIPHMRNVFFFPQHYQLDEIEFVKQHLPSDGTFVDVGANMGVFSLGIATSIKHQATTIVAIEADDFVSNFLKENIKKNGCEARILVIENGVSDKEEVLKFNIHPNNFGGNSFVSKFNEPVNTKNVLCRPLYDIIVGCGLHNIDVMKIDIEGYEFKALSKFFEEADASLWPRIILTEYHERLLKEAGGSTVELLLSKNYKLLKKEEINYYFSLEA